MLQFVAGTLALPPNDVCHLALLDNMDQVRRHPGGATWLDTLLAELTMACPDHTILRELFDPHNGVVRVADCIVCLANASPPMATVCGAPLGRTRALQSPQGSPCALVITGLLLTCPRGVTTGPPTLASPLTAFPTRICAAFYGCARAATTWPSNACVKRQRVRPESLGLLERAHAAQRQLRGLTALFRMNYIGSLVNAPLSALPARCTPPSSRQRMPWQPLEPLP